MATTKDEIFRREYIKGLNSPITFTKPSNNKKCNQTLGKISVCYKADCLKNSNGEHFKEV